MKTEFKDLDKGGKRYGNFLLSVRWNGGGDNERRIKRYGEDGR